MKLDNRTLRLIAVGASVTANCQPCLQTNVAKALESGADEQTIMEAIEVGKMVRQGAASKLDELANRWKQGNLVMDNAEGCGCQSLS
ncbi:MAG: carboxymuconolactone decarboxylase family protein [Chloroflexi bacterium]|nr:carboxymuconolactone decarboxylase family protein [Chloroflexota bacterium]